MGFKNLSLVYVPFLPTTLLPRQGFGSSTCRASHGDVSVQVDPRSSPKVFFSIKKPVFLPLGLVHASATVYKIHDIVNVHSYPPRRYISLEWHQAGEISLLHVHTLLLHTHDDTIGQDLIWRFLPKLPNYKDISKFPHCTVDWNIEFYYSQVIQVMTQSKNSPYLSTESRSTILSN